MKNVVRRKRRLKLKARQLTNEDLLAVLLLRSEASAASETASAGSDSASAAPSAPGVASPAQGSVDLV